MIIHGFQKMTLLDYPSKIACTVFTAGCNFRCPFCHNAPLVTRLKAEDAFTEEEILSYLGKRRGLLDGVCVTGGEPLLQDDFLAFAAKVKAMGFSLKLDTNGSFPDKLREALASGLVDYVAMDIKNARERYAETIGKDGFLDAVGESIALLKAGTVDYEFRTTVCRELHTPDDIEAIGKWIAGAPRYFIQGFVDSNDLVGTETLTAPERETLDEMLRRAQKYVPNASLRGIE